MVRINFCPDTSSVFPPSMSFRRISGPLVSRSVATGSFNSLLTLITRSNFALCSSWLPCEKLNLATFIPASISSLNLSSLSLAGPIVQIIFVFLILTPPAFFFYTTDLVMIPVIFHVILMSNSLQVKALL